MAKLANHIHTLWLVRCFGLSDELGISGPMGVVHETQKTQRKVTQVFDTSLEGDPPPPPLYLEVYRIYWKYVKTHHSMQFSWRIRHSAFPGSCTILLKLIKFLTFCINSQGLKTSPAPRVSWHSRCEYTARPLSTQVGSYLKLIIRTSYCVYTILL